ncbi:MAG TPA: hypothetical protein VFN23_01735, partial [Ktedonobacteraceae bacterium]|nr:hypothetical protein [Ktedonobacteraceae bacterium]
MPITRRRRANPPEQPENNNHLADHTESASESLLPEQASSAAAPVEGEGSLSTDNPAIPASPSAPASNGDRSENKDYPPPTIEGGRRTARGELFRRPPQAPTTPPAQPAPAPAPQLQPPTH